MKPCQVKALPSIQRPGAGVGRNQRRIGSLKRAQMPFTSQPARENESCEPLEEREVFDS